MNIRTATPLDVPLILRFIRALADYEKLSHTVSASPSLLHEHLFGQQRSAEVLIAEIDAEPAGFALYFTTFSTFLAKPGIWLEDLFVEPAFRKRGVGTSLLRAVAKIAADRGCGRLEWSVLDWNEPAIRVYKSLGAEPLDDWTIMRVTGEALVKLAGEDQRAKARG